MEANNNQNQNATGPSSVKKSYRRPELCIYGDVATLTQNMACGGNDGPAGQVLS